MNLSDLIDEYLSKTKSVNTKIQFAQKLKISKNTLNNLINNGPSSTNVDIYRKLMRLLNYRSMDNFLEDTENIKIQNDSSVFTGNRNIYFYDLILKKKFDSPSDYASKIGLNRGTVFSLARYVSHTNIQTQTEEKIGQKLSSSDLDKIFAKMKMTTYIKIAKSLEINLDTLYKLLSEGMSPQGRTQNKETTQNKKKDIKHLTKPISRSAIRDNMDLDQLIQEDYDAGFEIEEIAKKHNININYVLYSIDKLSSNSSNSNGNKYDENYDSTYDYDDDNDYYNAYSDLDDHN